MQHEILASKPLLNKEGNVAEPGFARKLLPIYDRDRIKVRKTRIKEWDYYMINNGRYGVALTIADNGYMGLDSISLLNFDEGWEITKSPMCFMPLGKIGLPATSKEGSVRHGNKNYFIEYQNKGGGIRRLTAHMDKFGPKGAIDIDITLTDEPEESMVIVTPFEKKGHFYYNQKINCLRAEGSAVYDGRTYEFLPDEAFGVLDWGRGVWTYNNTWYWGSASYKVGDDLFGWNIGYGFGDTSAASENMLFFNGKAHKLSQVKFNIPGNEKDFMSPWTFTSDDGRFEMDFVPVMDRASCTDALIIKSDQHQVFGLFTEKQFWMTEEKSK